MRFCVSKYLRNMEHLQKSQEVSVLKRIKCFPSTLRRTNHRPFWISVWKQLDQGNHVIIVTSSFSKNFVFKMFSVLTKTKSQRFQFPPVWGAFWKSSVFVTDWCGRYANRRNRAAFSNSSGLKNVSTEKLRFRDRSVWTVGLTVEISRVCVLNFIRCSVDAT